MFRETHKPGDLYRHHHPHRHCNSAAAAQQQQLIMMEYNGGAKNPSTIKYYADKVYTKNLFRIIVLQIYGPPPPTTSKFRAVKLSCLRLLLHCF